MFNIRGIAVENGNYITIKNNYTYNTVSSGIFVYNSTNITIDSNEVEGACADGEQECISLGTTDIFTISRNTVHDNGGTGIRGGEGIDAKDGSNNGLIYGNHVYNIHRNPPNGTVGLYVEVYNNISYDNDFTGILVATNDNGTGAPHPVDSLIIISVSTKTGIF